MTAVAVSFAFHVALLVAITLGFRGPDLLPWPEAVEVRLAPPLVLPPPQETPQRRLRPLTGRQGPRALPLPPLPVPAAPAPPADVAPTTAPRELRRNDGFDGARRVLRQTVGCDDAQFFALTASERADCDRLRQGFMTNQPPLPLFIDRRKTDPWHIELDTRARPQPNFVQCEGPGSNFGVACPAHKVERTPNRP